MKNEIKAPGERRKNTSPSLQKQTDIIARHSCLPKYVPILAVHLLRDVALALGQGFASYVNTQNAQLGCVNTHKKTQKVSAIEPGMRMLANITCSFGNRVFGQGL